MKEIICLKHLSNSERQNQSSMSSLFRPNLLKTGLSICIAVLSMTSSAWAQAGRLDPTFASNGILLLNPVGEEGGSTKVALQPDGKIVFAAPSGDPQQSNNGIALVRLNHIVFRRGRLDTTFGTGGAVVFGVQHTVPVGVVIQIDGKIVVASAAGQNADGGAGFGLARFNSNGSVDSSFGTGGHVDGISVKGAALALQPDGKILLTGSNSVARFDSNGQLDTSALPIRDSFPVSYFRVTANLLWREHSRAN